MKQFVFLLLISFLFSCKETIQKPTKEEKKNQLDIVQKYAKPLALNILSEEEITTWKEYNALTIFLKRFRAISANNALDNANEMTVLIKQLKDSLKPTILETPSFNARINVLENEALRLKDMAKIPAITANRVNIQVAKIQSVFNSLNEKINTVFKQKHFEEAVKVPVNFLDTSQTINKKKKLNLQKTPSKKVHLKNKKTTFLKPLK